jgi:hypothetical protein
MRLPTGPKSRRALVILSAGSLVAGLVASPTLAATTAGTDVLAGADALSEVTIDVNPTNPDNLVIAGHEPGGFENMNTFFTTNGGDTWTEVNLGDGQDGLTSNFRFDPGVVFDSAGNVFVAYGATVGTSTTLVVARSTNGGASYGNFAQLATTANITGGPPGNDRWAMDSGLAPGGAAGTRRTYISWTQNIPEGDPPSTDQRVVVSSSVDDGLTWSTPVIINDSSSGIAKGQLNADPAVQPDGDLFVSWHDGPGNQVLIDRSANGGITWGTDVVVTGTTAGFKTSIPAQPDRGIFAGPMIDVDRSSLNPGRIYAAYVDVAAGGSLPNTDIFVRSSDNDGATWSGRVLINDNAGTSSQFLPWLDVDPVTGLVGAVWYDARNDTNNKKVEVYGATSQDGGATWATNVKIADAQSDNSTDNATRYLGNFLEYIGVATYDCTIVPVWADLSANGGSNFDYMIDRVVETTGICIRPTTATYTGPTSGEYHDPLTVSGTLFDTRRGTPIAGRLLTIGFGTDTCTGTTDSTGTATCTFTPQQVPGPYKATASFAGDSENSASTSSEVDFTLNKEQTNLVNLQPAFFGNGDTVTVSATLTEDDPTPVAGRSVTFMLGTGITAQTCVDPATDSAGLATCQIVNVNQPQGSTTLRADFAGDAYYLASTASRTVVVFTWTPGGNFVIGDGSDSVGTTATFWADDWNLKNIVSGGQAPSAFKGFANNPPGKTTCGGSWSTGGGNSPPPPGAMPTYTAMLSTDRVTKSGKTITGTKPSIVIVRVNPGYSPNPGKTGTAEVLGVLCP